MSTRSIVTFLQRDKDPEDGVHVYRHFNGFPSTAGADLLAFLGAVDEQNKIPDLSQTGRLFESADRVAAWFIAWRVPQIDNFWNADISVGAMHGDIEHWYLVRCTHGGVFPKVQAFNRTLDPQSPVRRSWKWVEFDLAEALAHD